MIRRIAVALLATWCASAAAQTVADSRASYLDVARRHAVLATNTDPRIKRAIASLGSCTATDPVPAPTGRMIIPHHYLSGSHGPVNPEEEKVTRQYGAFERRVTVGMNQWLVSAGKDEARCAQQQIDLWAHAAALLDYDAKESSQAWFQVEWTLSAVAVSESVLVNEPALDPAMVKRDEQWMNKVAHRMVDFDRASSETNNHHDWRGLAAAATGVISADNNLFAWGVGVYKQAIDQIDQRGAFPQEMARHERAIHYQAFALQPLIPLAEFAERQHVPLYGYHSKSGRTVLDAVDFLGAAVADPAIVKAYTPDVQLLDPLGADFFSFAEFYAQHVAPAAIPAAIAKGLEQPTFATRIGGSTTVLAGSPAAPPKP